MPWFMVFDEAGAFVKNGRVADDFDEVIDEETGEVREPLPALPDGWYRAFTNDPSPTPSTHDIRAGQDGAFAAVKRERSLDELKQDALLTIDARAKRVRKKLGVGRWEFMREVEEEIEDKEDLSEILRLRKEKRGKEALEESKRLVKRIRKARAKRLEVAEILLAAYEDIMDETEPRGVRQAKKKYVEELNQLGKKKTAKKAAKTEGE